MVIHISFKDWNRNALQSHASKLASEGFDNVLALSGFFPTGGYHGQASGVFDFDSVGLLRMFSDLNAGLSFNAGGRNMERTRFFPGAAVSNFKRHEGEVMPQYFNLAQKIENGAAFIITQIGYDVRKQGELLIYMKLRGPQVPVLANVYVLSLAAARYFHAGHIPGVVVSDELLALAEKHGTSPDKGRAFFLEFAARQCAVAKGLGYRGVYLGGICGTRTTTAFWNWRRVSGRETGRILPGICSTISPVNFIFLSRTRTPESIRTKSTGNTCARRSLRPCARRARACR